MESECGSIRFLPKEVACLCIYTKWGKFSKVFCHVILCKAKSFLAKTIDCRIVLVFLHKLLMKALDVLGTTTPAKRHSHFPETCQLMALIPVLFEKKHHHRPLLCCRIDCLGLPVEIYIVSENYTYLIRLFYKCLHHFLMNKTGDTNTACLLLTAAM